MEITAKRHSLMAEDNFYNTKIQLVYNKYYDNSDTDIIGTINNLNYTLTKKYIVDVTSQLQNNQFEINKASSTLKSNLDKKISDAQIYLRTKLTSNTATYFTHAGKGRCSSYSYILPPIFI